MFRPAAHPGGAPDPGSDSMVTHDSNRLEITFFPRRDAVTLATASGSPTLHDIVVGALEIWGWLFEKH